MAVQAQHPTHVISTDHRNRIRQNNILISTGYGASDMEDLHFQRAVTDDASNQLRLFGTIASPNQVQPTLNGLINRNEGDLGCNIVATRKRSRQSDDPFGTTERRQQFIDLEDLQQNHSYSIPVLTSAGISRRFSVDCNRLNSTVASKCDRADSSNILSLLSSDISSQLQQQKDEVDLFIKVQGEQIRQMIEEKRQQFLTALLGAIEQRLFKRLRESAVEVERANRKNIELEDRIKQLSIEAHLWQKQAKSSEALVTALRCNLQQAVAFREHSKEGCGDSEDDDAASSFHGNSVNAHARAFQENRELKEQRTCRVCRCNDVCILLLPCRHLCLCKDCETRLDACPICRSTKNASVQVYMN